MNIDELKLVLEAINQFTAQATTAGIWWAAMHYALPALTKIIGIIAGATVVIKVVKLIASTHDWAAAGRRVSKAYGGSGYSMFYNTDETAINNAIALAIVRKQQERASKE